MSGKFVPIDLDKPRRLRYEINAFSDAEEAMGVSIGVALKSNMGIRNIRAMLWAALKWEERGLTLERMGVILQRYLEAGGTLEAVAEAITRAIMLSGLVKVDDEGNATGAETTGASQAG